MHLVGHGHRRVVEAYCDRGQVLTALDVLVADHGAGHHDGLSGVLQVDAQPAALADEEFGQPYDDHLGSGERLV